PLKSPIRLGPSKRSVSKLDSLGLFPRRRSSLAKRRPSLQKQPAHRALLRRPSGPQGRVPHAAPAYAMDRMCLDEYVDSTVFPKGREDAGVEAFGECVEGVQKLSIAGGAAKELLLKCLACVMFIWFYARRRWASRRPRQERPDQFYHLMSANDVTLANGAAIDLSYDVDSDGIEEEDVDSSDLEEGGEMSAEVLQGLEAFSDEEVESMIEMLKEQGMVEWLKEYVIRRGIPVRKLLLGLGVLLITPPDEITSIQHDRRRTDAAADVEADYRVDRGRYLGFVWDSFDIQYFKERPEVFYSFASQIYPSNFVPSPCHRFIKLLEDKDILLRNYTQNIDTLESSIGVQRVLQCHGSFATASCLECRRQVPGREIENAIFAKRVPLCVVCEGRGGGVKKKGKKKAKPWEGEEEEERPRAIMKPDITFFGEPLTDRFDKCLLEDRGAVDLLLVMGTSLKVAPVSEILSHLPHSVPQILINKTPVTHVNPDVVLLGDADGIVSYLCGRLGWELGGGRASSEPQRVGDSHVWVFDGAEGEARLSGKRSIDAAGSGEGSRDDSRSRDRDAKKPRRE
ncbi:NAD-dependent histone deacetylase sir2, partial [Tulasnella sp. 403]